MALMLIMVAWLFNSSPDPVCDNNSRNIYESQGKLCYKDNKFTTLENKADGKIIQIVNFTVLGEDKAIVHTPNNIDYLVLAKSDGLEIYPYKESEPARQENKNDFDNSEGVNTMNCHDYMNGRYDGFAFPSTGSSKRLYNISGLVCYQGRDITSWVAGDGMKVTSALIPNPKESLAIVTIEEKDPQSPKSKSSIRIIYVTQNGLRGKEDIIRQRYTEDPETTLTDMKIVGYNYEKGIVYFSVPAWVVSHAIHAFTIPFDNNYMNIKEKFVTDGDLTFVNMSNLVGKPENNKYIGSLVVEQSEIREGQGRVYGEYLISPTGKRICELDTDVENWRIYLPCKK